MEEQTKQQGLIIADLENFSKVASGMFEMTKLQKRKLKDGEEEHQAVKAKFIELTECIYEYLSDSDIQKLNSSRIGSDPQSQIVQCQCKEQLNEITSQFNELKDQYNREIQIIKIKEAEYQCMVQQTHNEQLQSFQEFQEKSQKQMTQNLEALKHNNSNFFKAQEQLIGQVLKLESVFSNFQVDDQKAQAEKLKKGRETAEIIKKEQVQSRIPFEETQSITFENFLSSSINATHKDYIMINSSAKIEVFLKENFNKVAEVELPFEQANCSLIVNNYLIVGGNSKTLVCYNINNFKKVHQVELSENVTHSILKTGQSDIFVFQCNGYIDVVSIDTFQAVQSIAAKQLGDIFDGKFSKKENQFILSCQKGLFFLDFKKSFNSYEIKLADEAYLIDSCAKGVIEIDDQSLVTISDKNQDITMIDRKTRRPIKQINNSIEGDFHLVLKLIPNFSNDLALLRGAKKIHLIDIKNFQLYEIKDSLFDTKEDRRQIIEVEILIKDQEQYLVFYIVEFNQQISTIKKYVSHKDFIFGLNGLLSDK